MKKPPASGPMTLASAEDRAEAAHVAAALAGGDDVADDRLGADHQPAAAEALDRPEPISSAMFWRSPDERRADRGR